MSGGGEGSRPARDWDAHPNVLRAREHLAAGRSRAAVRETWKAATVAVNTDDERGYAVVCALAREVEARSSGRTQRHAAVLASYVEHCRAASLAGVKQGSLLARLFGGPRTARTKTCPDCAEQVKAQAMVCRFCGHRFTAR